MKFSKKDLHAFKEYLFESIDPASLIVYRIAFGISVIILSALHLQLGWMDQYFINPEMNFGYYGLEWIEPLSPEIMYSLVILLGLSGLLIAVGWFYRTGSAITLVILSYFLLAEPAYYQNHIYLFILLSFIGIFLPLSTNVSTNFQIFSLKESSIPRISLWILRFQIGVVYLYGAIAKTESDWFHCQPLRSEFQNLTHFPWMETILQWPSTIFVATYGVLVFEYLIVPLLLLRKTRLVTFLAVVLFHVLNASFWTLDIFNWFMIAGTTVFFDPRWPRRIRLMRSKTTPANRSTSRSQHLETWILGFTVLYCLWQILIPFRHFLYEGKVGWNEWGRDFSWRMKLDGKTAKKYFFRVVYREEKRIKLVVPSQYLTESQIIQLQRQPRFIHQFTNFLQDKYRTPGSNPEVYANVKVAFNGRPAHFLVHPTVNLAEANMSWTVPGWVTENNKDIMKQFSCLGI